MRRPVFRLPQRDAIRAIRLRWQRTLLLAGLTGIVTGVGVALFDYVTQDLLLDNVRTLPHWLQAVMPAAGLVAAWAFLRWVAGRASPSTSDEYIRNFHDRGTRLNLRPVPGRILASIATLGSGGAMGFEGPSIYLGAAVGSFLQRRFAQYFSREDAKILLVAGAAAGVSAIFKTPATGALFALEVPYQQDVAARAALPAVLASATSYLTFVAFQGTTPLFLVKGHPGFDTRDLAGALAIGLLCGLAARAFAWLIKQAKRLQQSLGPTRSLALGAVGLAGIGLISFSAYGSPISLGPGYEAVGWITQPSRGLWLVGLLLLSRAFATAFTVGGGGAGGLFIPLVVEGAVLGGLVAGVTRLTRTTLFPLVGAAAFLGAGYRTPLAGVMFVAESTGQPGFVVPGLIATVIAQLVMVRSSVTAYQYRMRGGHVEQRFRLPVTSVLTRDPYTVPPSTTVDDLLHRHFVRARARALPVTKDGQYLGFVTLQDVADVPREERAQRTVQDVLEKGTIEGRSTWTLRQAVEAMETADVDQLPIVDGEVFRGVVTMDDILSLDEILQATEE
ncbi:MAG TPA: chloride channel protein [Actinomycetota bacterium]|jgi:CIC family chloride channel protein|nr:chloride channel protein [Actinomycetota bacterium]